MEEYYKKGVFKAIGVSNFHKNHLDELLKEAEVIPAVNQIELHPYLTQEDLVAYTKKKALQQNAGDLWLAEKSSAMKFWRLLQINTGKTISQIVLKWEVQRGLITIPKSIHKDRIVENQNIFDFELSA